MKHCPKCKIRKASTEFSVDRNRKDLLQPFCKMCSKYYRTKNKEKIKEYRIRNKEQLVIYRYKNRDKTAIYMKEYISKNKEKLKIYREEKMKNDIQFRLSCYLRSRLFKAIKNDQKKGSAVKDLGCTILELKFYIEGQFKDGMSWENWGHTGKAWHIDHKIPFAFFDLTDRVQLLNAVHYTNLQPMWANDNFRKNKKLEIINGLKRKT